VKDQYFGDVNDFRKHGLLRLLTGQGRLCLGICWMLTEPDRRTDGRFLAYLDQSEKYRHCDPELFDWFVKVVSGEKDRRTARIEASNLLGLSVFQSKTLTDNEDQRDDYFSECSRLFGDCDLVFFDPDNGLEVPSIRRGRKRSRKYLYWDEVCNTFAAGASVLIYQHFPHVNHSTFIARLVSELNHRISAEAIFSFKTPYVLFLLASQVRHVDGFRTRLVRIQSAWGPLQIVAQEHTALGPNADAIPRHRPQNRFVDTDLSGYTLS